MSTLSTVLLGLFVFFIVVIVGFILFNGGTSASSGTIKGWVNKWWSGLDSESSPGQRFVLLCFALLLGYAEFSFWGSVWVALIVLLIAAIIKPPKGWFTKAFVVLDLVLLIAAAFLPGFAEMRHTSYEISKTWSSKAATKMADYEKELKSAKPTTQPSQQAQVPTASNGLPPVHLVVQPGQTEEVSRPFGHYLAGVSCTSEVVMEVTDANTGALIQQQDCDATVRNGNLPLNIKLAFCIKGEDGEPVEVLVFWKKIV
jgi:hypothetical protein